MAETRHIFLCGASGGIGSVHLFAICDMFRSVMSLKLIERGYKVTLQYHQNKGSIDSILSKLGESSLHRVFSVSVTCNIWCLNEQIDVTSERSVQEGMEAATSKLGPIHSIVLNHGVWPPESLPIRDMDLTRWNTSIAQHLTGSFLFSKHFFRQAAFETLEWPSIVIIGSTAGIVGEEGHTDYAAAKGGLTSGFMMSLKNEIVRLNPRGRVNSVSPGWVLTASVLETNPPDFTRVCQTIPLRKVRSPVRI